MTTECEMKEALDGWFYAIDHRDNAIICKSVPKNHIPDHKPRWSEFDMEAIRVNGNAMDWDEDRDDLIVQRRNEGVTFVAIGLEIGVSNTAVLKRYRKVCVQRGLKQAPRVVSKPTTFPADLVAAVVNHKLNGKTFTDIAALVGLKRSQCYEIFRTYKAKQRRLAA